MSDKEEQSRSVHLKFSENELSAIDVWQENNHIRTRSEAIRQLVHRALKDSSASHLSLNEGQGGFTAPKQQKTPSENQLNDALEEKINDMVQDAVKRALSKDKS